MREKKKLLVTSNFFFSHHVFYSVRKLCPHLSIFLTSYLYLQQNWKSLKLACVAAFPHNHCPVRGINPVAMTIINSISLIGLKKTILGKRENVGDQHFLLIPQCFQKACSPAFSRFPTMFSKSLFFRVVKTRDYL